jgi:hypothetical protein
LRHPFEANRLAFVQHPVNNPVEGLRIRLDQMDPPQCLLRHKRRFILVVKPQDGDISLRAHENFIDDLQLFVIVGGVEVDGEIHVRTCVHRTVREGP